MIDIYRVIVIKQIGICCLTESAEEFCGDALRRNVVQEKITYD